MPSVFAIALAYGRRGVGSCLLQLSEHQKTADGWLAGADHIVANDQKKEHALTEVQSNRSQNPNSAYRSVCVCAHVYVSVAWNIKQ